MASDGTVKVAVRVRPLNKRYGSPHLQLHLLLNNAPHTKMICGMVERGFRLQITVHAVEFYS